MLPRTPRRFPRALAALSALATLAGLGLAAAPVATATTTVPTGFRLGPAQSLTSTANGYRLSMNADGNLVLYTDHSLALWTSGTAGRGPSAVTLQGDGNLVVRTLTGAATWATGRRAATTLSLQDDGNLVLRAGARAVWCTCAIPFQRIVGHPATLAAGQGLLGGDALVAGATGLTLQTDGNLVMRKGTAATWASGTRGHPGATLALQGDGNLVLRGSDRRALWTTGTNGLGVRTLQLGADGGLQLLTASGGAVWAVGTAVNPVGIAGDVFALLNRQRAANGLRALTSDPRLILSATLHNAAMSAANTLSHQLPGEAYFSTRITAAGYIWSSCAENIAWTSDTTSAGAQQMQTQMYDETPPNDGHRLNILSTSLTQVGVAVLVDARGKLWLTTDFGRPV